MSMDQTEAEALNAQFGIEDQVSFREQSPGFIVIDIANAQATAALALQGAQLLTWTPAGQPAVVWQSPEARFVDGKSVRGGVPVCWPWFGARPDDATLPAHGFVRTARWEVIRTATLAGSGATRVELRFLHSDATRRMWPHRSELELHVDIGSTLEMELISRNTGAEAFTMTQALHTYFAVGDIRQTRVTGLDGCDYLDKVGEEQRRRQQGPVTFSGETDRIYVDTDADCLIEDPHLQRRIRVSKRGSHSTVVWNPWIEKADRLGDLGEDGYLHMVCVESANAADDRVTLEPGNEYHLAVRYSVEALD